MYRSAAKPIAQEAGMYDQGQPGLGWTVVLRRRPVRVRRGRQEGGYTDEFEIICCECGDDPGLDYRDVSPELQRVRGPYPIGAGITAYVKHAGRHPAAGRGLDEPTCRAPRLVDRR
jgi:hypothetical protein